MGILRVDHPDIEDFISCKRDTTRLHNFNISVAATNDFMKAVQTGGDFSLVHPRTGKSVRKINARDLFEKIVTNAHATGEPGLVFIDRINETDPIKSASNPEGKSVPGTEDIEATNPCGEQPLGPGDACNLGSINLACFIDKEKSDFDWLRLKECIQLCVRFLDDVVEVNNYPLPFVDEATRNNRRIGLGIMGWAESLIMIGIAYDSEEAIRKADELMAFVQEHSHAESQRLSGERGCFPNWQYSIWADHNVKMRNATVTTIAPTGTISIIAGTSSGIEPLFAISFIRRVMGGTELIEVNPLFEQVAKQRGFYSPELMERIAREGTLKNIPGIPEDIKKIWVCSHDIDYSWHVRMQVAFQRHTDNAVSKTINLPHSAPVSDVREAYLSAWREGLKGITVYRDASRVAQVLNIRKTDPLQNNNKNADHADTAHADETADETIDETIYDACEPGMSNLKSVSRKTTAVIEATRETVPSPVVSLAVAACREVPKQTGKDKSSNHAVAVTSFAPGATDTTPAGNVYDISDRKCSECGSNRAFEARYEACVMCRVCGHTKC
jgi:ribonucleoside-diphosphate reductase alpha chain